MFTSHAGSIADEMTKAPSVALKAFLPVNERGMFRVVCSVVHTPDSEKDNRLVLESLNAALGGAVHAIEGSFKTVKDGVTSLVTGLVARNVRVQLADKASMSSMRLISQSSNMYMDGDDLMWQFIEAASGDILVQTNGVDDLVSINSALDNRCTELKSAGLKLLAQCMAEELKVGEGDFIVYFDDNQQRRQGMALANCIEEETGADTGKVLVDADGASEVVDKAQIVASVSTAELPVPELSDEDRVNMSVSFARGEHKLQDLVNYYRKIYGHNAEFFNAFKARLEGHQFYRPL